MRDQILQEVGEIIEDKEKMLKLEISKMADRIQEEQGRFFNSSQGRINNISSLLNELKEETDRHSERILHLQNEVV